MKNLLIKILDKVCDIKALDTIEKQAIDYLTKPEIVASIPPNTEKV